MFFEVSDGAESRAYTQILKNTLNPTRLYAQMNGKDTWGSKKHLRHHTICHKKHFVDPKNDTIHTQSVENVLHWLKKYIKSRGSNIEIT